MKPRNLMHSAAAESLFRDGAYTYKKDPNGEGAALKESVKSLKAAVERSNTDVEVALTKAAESIKAGNTNAADAKKQAGEAIAKAMEALEKAKAAEQEFVAWRDGEGQERKAAENFGKRYAEDPAIRRFCADKPSNGAVSMKLKTIGSNTTGTGDAGVMIDPQRVPGVIAPPDRLMTVRSLLGRGNTTSNAIEYVRETGFTSAAAAVAEATTKPESNLEFSLETAPVRTIAHWIRATTQVLDDVPMLEGYINGRLRYGLELEEEEQLLSGDGTGQNIFGLIPQSTAFDPARAQIGDTRIDIVRRAMTQVRLAEYRADAIMLHPDDWEQIELTKTSEGAYVWARPGALLMPVLWGLPVLDTTALEVGEFLVGAFRMAASVWDRMDARVELATQDRDNFIRNLVTIRAEQRLALAVYRPEGLVYGDFDTIVSG